MVERAKPVMRAIKLTPPRPSARASSATNRRRLCSFNTGAICRYRLRAARACAARIMHPSYVARFLAVNPPHAFLRRLWQHRLSCLWTGPNLVDKLLKFVGSNGDGFGTEAQPAIEFKLDGLYFAVRILFDLDHLTEFLAVR